MHGLIEGALLYSLAMVRGLIELYSIVPSIDGAQKKVVLLGSIYIATDESIR